MSESKNQPQNPEGKGNGVERVLQSMLEESDEIDLVEFFYRLLGSFRLILCLALAFALAMGAYSFWIAKPVYEATSVIYVLNRSDSVINMSDLQIGSALTNDYIKVFDLWEVHEGVISRLGLSYTYQQMQSMLTVSNDSNTRMLDITIQSKDPTEVAAIANAYADVVSEYIEVNMKNERPSIMSVALVPSNPVSPKKARNVVLGFLLGAVLGCVIVMIRMLADDKYKNADDIRKYTGLATLAAIPLDEEMLHEKRKANKKADKRERR